MASSFLEKGEKTSLPCAPASSGVWHPKEHRGGGLLPGTGGLKKREREMEERQRAEAEKAKKKKKRSGKGESEKKRESEKNDRS